MNRKRKIIALMMALVMVLAVPLHSEASGVWIHNYTEGIALQNRNEQYVEDSVQDIISSHMFMANSDSANDWLLPVQIESNLMTALTSSTYDDTYAFSYYVIVGRILENHKNEYLIYEIVTEGTPIICANHYMCNDKIVWSGNSSTEVTGFCWFDIICDKDFEIKSYSVSGSAVLSGGGSETIKNNSVVCKKSVYQELAGNGADGYIVSTNMELYSYAEMRDSRGMEWNADVSDSIAYSCKDDFTQFNQGAYYLSGEEHGNTPEVNYDNTLGFNYFALNRCNNSELNGNYGGIAVWDIKQDTLKQIDASWDIQLDMTLDYRIVKWDDNGEVNPNAFVDGKDLCEKNTITATVSYPFTNDGTSQGSYMIDIINDFGMALTKDNVSSLDDYKYFNGFYLACNDHVDEGSSELLPGIEFDFSKGLLGESLGVNADLKEIFGANGSSDKYYGFDYIDLTVKGWLVKGDTRSQYGYGTCDLISGLMTSYVGEVDEDEDGNQTENIIDGTEQSNDNYFSVDSTTDSFGNTVYNYYYTDTTTNTTTNVTNIYGNGENNEVSGSGDVTVKFGNDLDININLPPWMEKLYSGTLIEDDDYTQQSLIDALETGYGLFDDKSTPEADDGYTSLIWNIFDGLDNDLDDLIGFGIGSTVVIAILRGLLGKR